ncbi:MAG: C10 family peptidase [Duncaniella sp.]|nr:C10 family peptidase [Duncaniella sp.]
MIKKFFFTAIITSAVCAANAATISPEQALQRLDLSGMRKSVGIGSTPRYARTLHNLYIFDTEKGFLILPDDDRAPALLGYADSDSFSTVGNPAFNAWLEFYNEELDYIKSLPEDNRVPAARPYREEISPLITTEWNQEWPYNIDCPKVDGHETVTGCVATAMAQGMKYYNYPERGKGEHSYWWSKGKETLTFNYDNHPFKWDLMADKYDRETPYDQRQAVAELMYACGVSVNMYYEPGGSGAATITMGVQLIDIFGYSSSMYLPGRVYYGLDEWEEMIYADLAKGQPVLYSGAGTAGGHQFICDGYRGDGYFHFNWGWGGLSNGYFLLTALNPDDLGVGGGAGGFNSSQSALLNFRPTKAGDEKVYIVTNSNAFKSYVSEVKEGEPFKCTGSYFNYSLYSLPDGTRLGMKFTQKDGGEVVYAEGPEMDGFGPEYGREDLEVKFPHLPDGIYIITPALHADGKWVEVRTPVGLPGQITATVKSGVATLTGQSAAEVEVVDISYPETIYDDHSFPLQFNIKNTGALEFYSDVTPYLTDNEGKDIAKSVFRPVDVLPGETLEVNDYIAAFKATDGEKIIDGEYMLVFKDRTGRVISKAVELTISPAPDKEMITYTDFHMVTRDPVTDPSEVVFAVTVNCVEGYYYGAPHIDIFHGWGGDDIYSKGADSVYLTSGESKEIEFHADLSRLADGEYMCTAYDAGKNITGVIRFKIERPASDIVEITVTDTDDTVIYNLSGIRQKHPITPGIYVTGGKKIIIR